MKLIIATIMTVTGLQLLVCHFSLWWLLSLVARVLFTLRRIGAVIPIRRLIITECVGLALMFLFYVLFRKGDLPVMRMLLNTLFCVISFGIMIYDDVTYVYDTVDVED